MLPSYFKKTFKKIQELQNGVEILQRKVDQQSNVAASHTTSAPPDTFLFPLQEVDQLKRYFGRGGYQTKNEPILKRYNDVTMATLDKYAGEWLAISDHLRLIINTVHADDDFIFQTTSSPTIRHPHHVTADCGHVLDDILLHHPHWETRSFSALPVPELSLTCPPHTINTSRRQVGGGVVIAPPTVRGMVVLVWLLLS
ncbi:uncharacterized protein LOC112569084 [Pomacea canaliculata]|uniref:uncharacterized protein LOC112569084 n=1 Tax=Pomacea canaliculata TaxID=400727 RepID=UPI000D7367AF|nr:uncharacterized protein LOC112569084 [Pomacea canaliculata]